MAEGGCRKPRGPRGSRSPQSRGWGGVLRAHDQWRLGGAKPDASHSLTLGKSLVFQRGKLSPRGCVFSVDRRGGLDPTSKCGDRNRPGALWGTQPRKASSGVGWAWGPAEERPVPPLPPTQSRPQSPVLSNQLVTRSFWGPGISRPALKKEALSWGPPSCPKPALNPHLPRAPEPPR